MILDLHRQGAGVSAIARRTGLDRKTVRKVIAGGLEPPVYGPRPHRVTQLQPFEPYLRERLAAVPELTGRRLHRELTALGYRGGYTAVTDLLREIRPVVPPPFELRFETPPGQQAQVDFAQFQTEFTDEPGVIRIASWLCGHGGVRPFCGGRCGRLGSRLEVDGTGDGRGDSPAVQTVRRGKRPSTSAKIA
jgi:transposase